MPALLCRRIVNRVQMLRSSACPQPVMLLVYQYITNTAQCCCLPPRHRQRHIFTPQLRQLHIFTTTIIMTTVRISSCQRLHLLHIHPGRTAWQRRLPHRASQTVALPPTTPPTFLLKPPTRRSTRRLAKYELGGPGQERRGPLRPIGRSPARPPVFPIWGCRGRSAVAFQTGPCLPPPQAA